MNKTQLSQLKKEICLLFSSALISNAKSTISFHKKFSLAVGHISKKNTAIFQWDIYFSKISWFHEYNRGNNFYFGKNHANWLPFANQ